MNFLIKLLSVAGTIALSLAANAAYAQTAVPGFPDKPLRIVVTFTSGGAPDTLARILSEKLSNTWGQPVIVDNKPGAGGVIASQSLMQAPADGYITAPQSHAFHDGAPALFTAVC